MWCAVTLSLLFFLVPPPVQDEKESLVIFPETGFTSRGMSTGPFQPDHKVFLLYNTTEEKLAWTASTRVTWLSLSETAGTIPVGSRTPVVVLLGENAGAELNPGRHETVVEFRDVTNDTVRGRSVLLTIVERSRLRVLPGDDRRAVCIQGAPHDPAPLQFELSNTGSEPIEWRLSASAPWLELSRESGGFVAGQRAPIEVRIDRSVAGELPIGFHDATISFENLTSGIGDTTRDIRLLVRGAAGLVLEAGEIRLAGPLGGPFAPEWNPTLLLKNAGNVGITWHASSSADWADLSTGGGRLQPDGEVVLGLTIAQEVAAALPAGRHRASVVIVNETDGVGTTSRWIELVVDGEPGETAVKSVEVASRVEQFGITWSFDREYPVGRFANGDLWVVGPVLVMEIDPPSVSGSRAMNGSMINPSPKSKRDQGYDSSSKIYESNLNVALDVSPSNPLMISSAASLVSTISLPGGNVRPQLETAAVLTVLTSVPPLGSFRPPYSGADKTIRYNKAQLDYSLLERLPLVGDPPPLSQVEDSFERVWLDHTPGWGGSWTRPQDNMPNYGREIAVDSGRAALLLHCDFTDAQKETLLVRYVQVGIDNYGVLLDGGQNNWYGDGGWASGRKWPVIFAGLMLGDSGMTSLPTSWSFGEDEQTFYVQETSPGVYNQGYGGYGAQHVGLADWGIRHRNEPNRDDVDWFGSPYRLCCTANSWWSTVLACRIMGAQALWNHPALFDYQDRFLEENTRRGIVDWRLTWSTFALQMWKTYEQRY